MNQRTLLEVIQVYLTYSNGTEVDSVHSTDEAYQAAQIAREIFYRVTDKNKEFQGSTRLSTLDHLGDLSKPNYLVLPAHVNSLTDALLKYNKSTPERPVNYRTVQYMDSRDFLDLLSNNNLTDDKYEVIQNFDGVSYIINCKKHPDYFTTFDGKHLVFDSYDKTQDSALQASKSQVICNVSSDFFIEDDFVIPLPANLLAGYQDAVINECLLALRQEVNQAVARRANAFMTKLQQVGRTVGDRKNGRRTYGRHR